MESYSKPLTFGLGLAIGVTSSCVASYVLLKQRRHSKRKLIKTESRSTQTLENLPVNVIYSVSNCSFPYLTYCFILFYFFTGSH